MHLELEIPRGTGWREGERWNAGTAWEFLRAHSSWDEKRLRFELHRYLGWPGQVPSYKLGERVWLQAREEAKARAGDAFSLKDFHSKALSLGAMGLDPLRDACPAARTTRQLPAGFESTDQGITSPPGGTGTALGLHGSPATVLQAGRTPVLWLPGRGPAPPATAGRGWRRRCPGKGRQAGQPPVPGGLDGAHGRVDRDPDAGTGAEDMLEREQFDPRVDRRVRAERLIAGLRVRLVRAQRAGLPCSVPGGGQLPLRHVQPARLNILFPAVRADLADDRLDIGVGRVGQRRSARLGPGNDDSHRLTLAGPKKSAARASGGVVQETEEPCCGTAVHDPLCEGAGPENVDVPPAVAGRAASYPSARKYRVTGLTTVDQLFRCWSRLLSMPRR